MSLLEALSFLFGLCFGSFLNVVIYRIPNGLSILSPPSFCPSCRTPIRFHDNIPILSYLFLQGRCRHCKAKIPLRYPLVELLTGLLFLLLLRRFGLSLEFLSMAIFLALLLPISFIDLEHKIIPDVLSISGIFLGLLLSLFRNPISFKGSLFGLLLGGGILFLISFVYELFTKREGMGGGDIKLLAMIGSFLGVKGVLFSLIVASFIGTCVGIPLMIAKGADTKYAIPFGPFLSLSALIYIVYGDLIIFALLRLLLLRGGP